MNGKKLLFSDGIVIIPRDEYIRYCRIVAEMRDFMEKTESYGDDVFQAHILLAGLDLLTRGFESIDYFKVSNVETSNDVKKDSEAVFKRMVELTNGFTRLPSEMSPDERRELEILENKHSELFRKFNALVDAENEKAP